MATPDPQDLVQIFDTQQETEAMVIQGLLDSAGIESLITPFVGPQDVLPLGGVSVRVSRENEQEARRIIAAYHDDSNVEIELDESTPDA